MRKLRQIASMSRWMLGALAVAVTAIALTVTGASGKESNSSAPQTQGDVTFAPGPPPAAIEDFKNCMSDHGVDVPEPGEPFDGEPGVHEPSAEERQAFEACEDELPRPPDRAGMLPPPPGSKAFRECMAKHGADLPPPPGRRGNND